MAVLANRKMVSVLVLEHHVSMFPVVNTTVLTFAISVETRHLCAHMLTWWDIHSSQVSSALPVSLDIGNVSTFCGSISFAT